MKMYFVLKTAHLHKLLPLDEEETSILCHPSDYTPLQKEPLIEKLLAYRKKAFILCNCQEKISLLHICKRNNGNIYVRRNKEQPHSPQCVFSNRANIFRRENSLFFSPSPLKTFALYTRDENLIDPTHKQNHHHVINNNKLGSILYTLITEAKINIQNPYEENKNKINNQDVQKQLINIHIQCRNKIVFEGFSLDKFFFRSLKQEVLEWIKNRCKNKPWPKNLDPFCLLLLRPFGIGANSFSVPSYKKNIIVKNVITLPSTWIDRQSSGPYLVLCSVLIDENSRDEIYFRDAFALPILSLQQLMPVESKFERTILKAILDLTGEFLKLNIEIEIEKPLFCLVSKFKNKYRPDFILSIRKNHKIFIEVLGSRNEEYLAQKEKMQQINRAHCQHYISVAAYAPNLHQEINNFKAKLKEIIFKI